MSKKYFNSQDARHLINTYGFALFPAHGINENGICTCGNSSCSNKGKHPACPNGFKDATKDIERLKQLWAGRKGLNVGIATGKISNTFVIDIDSDEGEKNLKSIGQIPDTLTVKTAKGRHLFFQHPGHDIVTKRGVLTGVDIRGDGGYVVGPLSHHASGTIYDFINPLEDIAPAPKEIIEIATKTERKNTTIPGQVIEFSAPRLLKTGWTIDDARDHLSYINPDIGYDEWIAVGMALQSEGFSFNLWDEWSRGGTKYDANNMADHWKSFKPNSGVSYGTIVHMAQDGGWGKNKPSLILSNAVASAIAPRIAQDTFDPETGEIITVPVPPPTALPVLETNRRLPLLYASDIQITTEASDFVEDVLREKEFSVIYGESNCGKTFFMLDIAMHVALGRRWRDKHVDQGGVIYAALEGGHGTKNRIMAFRQHHNITQDIPLAVIPSNINFLDEKADLPALINAIGEASSRIGNIKLIVVDTLARAMSGGDENNSTDMGQIVINADQIRAITGAHISFIHHSGKDAAKGARGHSSLRAAVDTEIEIKRDNKDSPSIIRLVKQREMEMIDDMGFKLEPIILGSNTRGGDIVSCVTVPCAAPQAQASSILTAIQRFVYDSIVDALIAGGSMIIPEHNMPAVKCINYFDLYQKLEARGFKELISADGSLDKNKIKIATNSARIALKSAGKINFNSNFIWLTSWKLENL